jgi:hypothetical protein
MVAGALMGQAALNKAMESRTEQLSCGIDGQDRQGKIAGPFDGTSCAKQGHGIEDWAAQVW